jgi:hypothetical protein
MDSVDNARSFTGALDEIKLWTRALTAAEILYLAQH